MQQNIWYLFDNLLAPTSNDIMLSPICLWSPLSSEQTSVNDIIYMVPSKTHILNSFRSHCTYTRTNLLRRTIFVANMEIYLLAKSYPNSSTRIVYLQPLVGRRTKSRPHGIPVNPRTRPGLPLDSFSGSQTQTTHLCTTLVCANVRQLNNSKTVRYKPYVSMGSLAW